jgi:predicted SAM-dependent methyltransferase
MVEHLTFNQAQNMLKECYRVMKPGAVMRIATPDLRFLLGLYEDPEKPIHKAYMENSVKNLGMPPTPAYVISRFHTSWGHQIIYDRKTLTQALTEAGFKDITPCEMSESKHQALNDVERHFNFHPYEFIHLETMILEATK